MKALWVRQPYASLIAVGVKQWETRGGPPNGSMRPAGVRGMPGLPIEAGERIAIVASKRWAKGWCRWYDLYTGQDDDAVGVLDAVGAELTEAIDADGWYKLTPRWAGIPLGQVVCTVVVAEALPMYQCPPYGGDDPDLPQEGAVFLGGLNGGPWVVEPGGYGPYPIHDQLPYGDWTPGRWAWRLEDVEPVERGQRPVITRGTPQGVCEIEEPTNKEQTS